MAILKCKMCAGQLTITEGSSVCTCDFCGTEQTIPKVADENIQNLFNRANNLRMKAEFDKAAEIYEKILQSDGTEAEGYWGLILCKYGIEYVEDPVSYKRIPTCHRASFDAVTADDDYKMALQYADMGRRSVYESEAKQIEEIQKGIIALAQKEDPYDVFICYKESDENGKRTPDSVIANDIYYQLTQEGYKVFYAAITLEDKLGQEYEPYIFSALNSARVMLSIGTKPEYFEAVWVKNEWSRFLKIMKKDRARMLIPCYKDMDAYDLPEDFAHLQAQDMSKIGFINDLVRGIKKVIVKDEAQATNAATSNVVVQQVAGSGNSNALIKRGNMALEDGEWQKADDFFEEVLNQDAECAEAYLGKYLIKCKCSGVSEFVQEYISEYEVADTERLEACPEDGVRIAKAVSEYTVLGYLADAEIKKQYVFDRTYLSETSSRKQQKNQAMRELANEKLLARAQQYATGETKTLIDKMISDISAALDERILAAEQADKASIASTKSSYETHLNATDAKVAIMHKEANKRQEAVYNNLLMQMDSAQTIAEYEKVRYLFKNLHGYKDTEELAKKCQKEIDRLNEEERIEAERLAAVRRKEIERASKKKRIIVSIVSIAVVACIAVFLLVIKVIIPNKKYNAAVELMNNEKYEEAINAFDLLEGYKDSVNQIALCEERILERVYNKAVELMNEEDYEEAINAFNLLEGYKDSINQIALCEEHILEREYNKAIRLMNSGQYEEAKYIFIAIGDYKDSEELCYKSKLLTLTRFDTITFGNYNGNTEWTVLANEDGRVLIISKYAIEKMPYNSEYDAVTWEECTLRKWLNETYITSAFSSDEQESIMTTTIVNTDNVNYGTKGGNNTDDKIFLLSLDEANNYLDSFNRKSVLSDGTSVGWWLRSPGYSNGSAASVSSDGSVLYWGCDVNNNYGAVRPAMWIDISKLLS